MKTPLPAERGAARDRESETGRMKQGVTTTLAAAKGVAQIKIVRCRSSDEPVFRPFDGKRSARSPDESNVRGDII